MDTQNLKTVQDSIRMKYAEVARSADGKFTYLTGRSGAAALQYPPVVIDGAPAEILDSFCGVGDPFSLGEIFPGEAVLDIGCGSGFDLYVAGMIVGPSGQVSGIDITPEMVDKSRYHLSRTGLANVLVRVASSEAIPFDAESFDVVISNGVLNLSPDKEKSFREIHRVLRPGGRLQFTDIILKDTAVQGDSCSIDSWAQ